MYNIREYYFFRCTFCGMWHYTNRIIKTKKCVKCNRSFQFQKSTKFSKKCSIKGAIAILKELKNKMEKENLSKYIYMATRLKIRKNE